MHDVGQIYIIDNGSTYEPLLNWYATNPCTIIKLSNIGHTAPWNCGLLSQLNVPYVVTDPDLEINSIPSDTLNFLFRKLEKNPHLKKVGLKLNSEIVSPESPLYEHLQTFEKKRWETSNIIDGIYTDVHIDTTFALYNTKDYFVGGGSVNEPYIARHLPWEFTEETRRKNSEYLYYIDRASDSSCYKKYLNL